MSNAASPAANRIDRQSLVARHRVVRTTPSSDAPLQVGNGNFAFGVDLTGLQTFVPFNTMRRTAEKVFAGWNFNTVWGWDYPMLAMCAARLGQSARAVDFLTNPAPRFAFRDNGLADGGPFPYFPSNGGLLYAVALMAAGWDGAPNHPAPGFPTNGTWTVTWEGLTKAL